MSIKCRNCKEMNKEWAIKYIDTPTNTCVDCSMKRREKDYCLHDKRYHDCRDCVDGRIISAQNWFKVVRNDKIDGFTQNDLIEMANRADTCYYPFCQRKLQYENPHVDDFATLERLDNSIRHTKQNCVVACWRCNVVERVSYRHTH